ncbi:hypothetical protein QUF51_01355 [Bacillus pumilus]|nr:hypothetical protein [Bacillus pumilus]OLP65757.1 hypothetical protein BACPU_13750 [Bacillus pumilus]
MKAFFWSVPYLFMLILTLVFLGIVFWFSGQGMDQLWRYILISLITAAVLHGITRWLKCHIIQITSK